MKRSKKIITYHGRKGHPLIHSTPSGRVFIMVRAIGGGVRRLYEGSRYRTTRKGKKPGYTRLKLR